MSNHVPVRLQLNLPALERLLGGDTQLEVELRQQVVQQFVEKHLKGIVDTEAVQQTLTILRKRIEDSIREQVGTTASDERNYYSTRYSTVEGKINGVIQEIVKKQLEKLVSESYLHHYEEHRNYWHRQMNDAVRTAVAAVTDKLIEDEIGDRVSKALDKRVEILVESEIQRRLKAAMMPGAKS